MEKLTADYKQNIELLDRTLRVDENFDLIRRRLPIGQTEVTLYYIDGFIKDETMQKLMQYFITLPDAGNDAHDFAQRHVPYVEVDVTDSFQTVLTMVLSGAAAMIGERFGAQAIIIDARTYPARQTQEPESDRVMRGSKDGFVETLIFNTALIRRRLRDPRLVMQYKNLGGSSRTDVVLCYLDGVADPKYVRHLSELLDRIRPSSITLGEQSLAETLIRRRWYNPFPKIRTTERPDAAAAQLIEGSVLILCDTSPHVMILPTSILDFLQETDDYYLPPLTGSYLRILRLLVCIASVLLTPSWYLLLRYQDYAPAWLSFALPATTGELPILLQLFLAELAIDVLSLASMNTPNMLANSLSVISGLILGDFAVMIGWLSPDVILYMAIVSIGGFSQQNVELSYAFKFMRVILLAFTGIAGIWGYLAGIILIPLLLSTNRTVNGDFSYLAPLIPFRPRALRRLLFRMPKYDLAPPSDKKE